MPSSKWLGALQERNFRLFFIGQTASSIGSGMAPVAIVFAILAHGTASDVGYVLAAQTVPLVILLLVGGVVGDRVNRRTLMLQSDLLRTLAEFALGLWVVLDAPPVWGFMALGALMGVGQAFFSPALTGIVPQMLSGDQLQQGNALNGISNSSGGIAGPAIAGVIVAVFNPGWAILADALSYLISVISLAMVHIDWNASETKASFSSLLREGWHEFWSRTWLWVVVIEFSLFNALFASFFVLGPVVAKASLGGAKAWGLILAAEGVGAVLGGVVMLRIHPRRPLLVATLSTFGSVIPLYFIALHSLTVVVAAAAFLSGISLSIFGVQWSTTMQREIPTEMLSRLSAYDWFGSLVLLPLGMAVVGPVSSVIGVKTTLIVCASTMVALIVATLCVPSVTRLQLRPHE
ncbi:MAG TPA: MFS transporter [Acidimicrobiales bacterium]